MIVIRDKFQPLLQLSVIIVSYNVKYFLEQCLCSVMKAGADMEMEVFVVDNASADNSIEYLLPKFPSVTFIQNNDNPGFGKANNQALKIAAGQFILFLNPDTILAEDSLTTCFRFMKTHPAAGACGVRMIDGSGRFLPESKRGFPSLKTSFYKMSGLTALFPGSKRYAYYYLGHLAQQLNHEVDVLAGAYFFASKETLHTTGGFDERFFMYGEDIDLSYRIRKAGCKNYYLAETTIIHFKGESTKKQSMQTIRHFYGAMNIFVHNHYAKSKAVWFSIFIQLLIRFKLLLAITRNLIKQKPAGETGAVHTLIAGDEQSAEQVRHILSKYPTARKISVVPAGADLLRDITKQPADEIIFCEKGISFKKIIGWMQTLPATTSYKIHAAGSSSIVGSNLKNTHGDVYS